MNINERVKIIPTKWGNYFSFIRGAKSANSRLFKDFCSEVEMKKNSQAAGIILTRSLRPLLLVILIASVVLGAGCANQTMPTGGRKDIIPPKLLSITPADSLKNTRVKRIELNFDEYITVNDVVKEVQISPILAIQPVTTSNNRKVIVKIADTLLEEHTTYRVSFGIAIRDLHEGNVFANYTYVFSTGAYFDSLQLAGKVVNALTGLPDSGGANVVLFYDSDNDSAIVRRKPRYITRTGKDGSFTFKGLPGKKFRIYALRDANDNLIYDKSGEMIAFNEQVFSPADTLKQQLILKLFTELDTATKHPDSLATGKDNRRGGVGGHQPAAATNKENFSYSVNIDTSAAGMRSFDITQNIVISFNKMPTLNKDKITLSYDSNGVSNPAIINFILDTAHTGVLKINALWHENTVYTLRLVKGFAKDSAGAQAMPSKYNFRTKEDEDYGKINIQLPFKYNNPRFVLVVLMNNEVYYQHKITTATVPLTKLTPAKYTFRIIDDKNGNGKWDTGDLFLKIQPEDVIPYEGEVNLKPGWENVVDFDKKPNKKKLSDR